HRYTTAKPLRNVLDRLDQSDVKRIFGLEVQLGNRPARLVEASLGGRCELCELNGATALQLELAGPGRDEGELLSEPVMQVACDASALFEYPCLGVSSLVNADLAGCADEKQGVEAQPKRVARIDPLRVERRKEKVVHAGE